MLSNLYLADVDSELTERGFTAIRYGDDVLILAETENEVGDALAVLGDALAKRSLTLSARKTARGHATQGFSFLGRRFDASGALRSEKALTALSQRLMELHASADGELGGELYLDFTRWYGALQAAEVDDGTILAAAADGVEANALAELAERRRSIMPRLGPAGHLSLVRRWLSLGRDSMPAVQCALLDARRALLGGADTAVVADTLGVPEATSAALHESAPWLAAAEFGKAGFVSYARAARRLAATPGPGWSRAEPTMENTTKPGCIGASSPGDPLVNGEAPRPDLDSEVDSSLATIFMRWTAGLPLEVERTNARGQLQFVPLVGDGARSRIEVIRAHCQGRARAAASVGKVPRTPLIAIRFATNQEAIRRELPEEGALQRLLEAHEAQVHMAAASWHRAASGLGLRTAAAPGWDRAVHATARE